MGSKDVKGYITVVGNSLAERGSSPELVNTVFNLLKLGFGIQGERPVFFSAAYRHHRTEGSQGLVFYLSNICFFFKKRIITKE